MPHRLTVGLLTHDLDLSSDLDTGFQSTFWRGVDDESRALDINLITFLGGEIDSILDYQRKRNVIFRHPSLKNLDGLLVVTSILSNFIGVEGIIRFLKVFDGIPIVSAGLALDQYPSLVIDNYSGLKRVVKHLIQDHGCRSLAFIGGPEKNLESEMRYKAFIDALSESGIEPDKSLLGNGQFLAEYAKKVVHSWIEEGKHFDAIVGANDYMALAAIEVLQSYGIRVPDDVKVTGFDNIELSYLSKIPLTTISSPMHHLGREGLKHLYKILKHEPVEHLVNVAVSPVFRRSCGCIDQFTISTNSVHGITHQSKVDTFSISSTLRDRTMLLDITTDYDQVSALVQDFNISINHPDRKDFISSLTCQLDQVNSGKLIVYKELLELISTHCDVLSPDANQRAEQLIINGIFIIKNAEIRELGSRIEISNKQSLKLQDLSSVLQSTLGIGPLLDNLSEHLDNVGIISFHLVIYSQNDTNHKSGKLFLGKDRSYCYFKNVRGYEFDLHELLPQSLYTIEHQYSHIIQALLYKNSPFGYFIVEVDRKSGNFSNELTRFLVTGISNAFMSQELIDSKISLEQANTEIRKNSAELTLAYELLKKNQEQLISSEKMVALGRLTAGIAHEINTPLAATDAALKKLSQLSKELSSCVGDSNITVNDYREIISEIDQCSSIISKATNQAANFVNCIRSQTRDSGDELQTFDIIEKINQVEVLLGFELKSSCIHVIHDFDKPTYTLWGQPQKFTHIVTNLITNAIDALKSRTGREIKLLLRSKDGHIILTVRDNGCGISPEHQSRIFDPLFSTKPFGTTSGMGLTVVQHLVQGEFKGSISFDSEPGKGTTFYVAFKEYVLNEEPNI